MRGRISGPGSVARMLGLATGLAWSCSAAPALQTAEPDVQTVEPDVQTAVESPPPDEAAAPAAAATPGHPAGARLASAIESHEAGDMVQALAALDALATEHPWIADHADRLRVEWLLDSGAPAEAVEAAEKAVATHENSPVAARLYRLLGEAYLEVGSEAAARDAWRRALRALVSGEEAAGVREALADSLERSGRVEEAGALHLDTWRSAPTTAAGLRSGERLARIEERVGRPLRRSTDHLERADALFTVRDNEAALASYQEALAGGLLQRDARRVREQMALCLFRLRRYDEAALAYGALAPDLDAAIEEARAIARNGRPEEGARRLEELGHAKRGPRAIRALFLSALLWDGEKRKEHAATLFAEIVVRAPRSKAARESRWRLGWLAYREGRHEAALEQLSKLHRAGGDEIDRLQARYWSARSLAALGRTEEAEAALAAIASEFPLSYYGWRAVGRLERTPPPRGAPPIEHDGDTVFEATELDRVRVLEAVGLSEWANVELARLEPRAKDLDDRLAVAQLYAEAGEPHRAQRLIVAAYTERLARGPAPGQEEVWQIAWPAAWESLVTAATGELGVPPALVYAVMREESGFRPAVVSPVGARGLLQIMPETGTRLAGEMGLAAFHPDDLFQPETNIRLGVFYLDQLTNKFDGRKSAAIGSYNAGPEAVARWLVDAPDVADDVWVEEIPYQQTRTYVKRVLRSLHAYRALYP